MRIDILTVLPSLLKGPFSDSIIKRARKRGLARVHIHDIRKFSLDKHRKVDDYAFGGGAGMVLQIEPIYRCIEKLKKKRTYDEIIFMTPDGVPLKQGDCNELSMKENIMILAGHYKGVDERVRELLNTREISIGDYVLSGGEIAAAALCDAVIRLIPGVLNDETSALSDSFQDNLLSPPVYTRPAEFMGLRIPPVLASGNAKAIEEWRHEMAIERTRQRRPDLLEG